MIVEKHFDHVPPDLLPVANEVAKLAGGLEKLTSYIAFSKENAYIKDDLGRPVLFVGAFAPSFLTPYKEVWIVLSEYLNLGDLRELRSMLREWLDTQTHKVIVRCFDEKSIRFAKVMGFEPVRKDGAITLMEAK